MGENLPQTGGTLDTRADAWNGRPNLKNLSRRAFMVCSDPRGDILYIWNCRGYHDKPYSTTPQFHPRYYDFESTATGFVQDVDLRLGVKPRPQHT